MSWGPVRPAETACPAHCANAAPAVGGGDHAAHATELARARQRFLEAHDLPVRWQGCAQFVVLETGLGGCQHFLAAWAAWRADAQRSTRLVYLVIDAHPPSAADLARALAIHQGSALQPLADALLAQWPPLTPDIHTLDLRAATGEPPVQLMLAWGQLGQVLPELVARVDAVQLGSFAAGRDDLQASARLLRGLNRLAAPGCTVAADTLAPAASRALVQAGFVLAERPGQQGPTGQPAGIAANTASSPPAGSAVALPAGTWAGTTAGVFLPRHVPAAPPGRRGQPQARRVAVVGAGLAGASAARALARHGLQVQVFEALAGPAQGSSGQAGGLFHGTVHWPDGPHARWLRAAALRAAQVIGPLVRAGVVAGQVTGLLRGESRRPLAEMHGLLARAGLPPAHVQVLAEGWPAGGAAWLYPGGGWASPAELVAAWLQSPRIQLHTGQPVARLASLSAEEGAPLWQLLDDHGRLLAEVDAVVLAHAQGVQQLLPQALTWPLVSQRGQTTLLDADLARHPALALPVPLAAGGYSLRLADGRVLCGATQQDGDTDPHLRATDQADNLAALQRLTGWAGPDVAPPLAGRVGWRLATDDKLPLLGPVPLADPAGQRLEQPRHVPRVPGLWVLTALGSRGITQAALAGEVLAAWLTESPIPLPASLIDALDPARYVSRGLRRQAAADSLKRS